MDKEIKKMFHDFSDVYRDPRQVINSLETAKNELSYSNYDNFNLDIAILIVKKFCKDNKIPLDFK